MGKLKKKKKRKGKLELTLVLSHDEVDMVTGIIHDFLDNPERQVSMRYGVDGDNVKPSKRGRKTLKGLSKAFSAVPESKTYDYFDYWEPADWS